jgi:hypothetical protein
MGFGVHNKMTVAPVAPFQLFGHIPEGADSMELLIKIARSNVPCFR